MGIGDFLPLPSKSPVILTGVNPVAADGPARAGNEKPFRAIDAAKRNQGRVDEDGGAENRSVARGVQVKEVAHVHGSPECWRV